MSFGALSLGVPSRLCTGPTGALKASRTTPRAPHFKLFGLPQVYEKINVNSKPVGVSIYFFLKRYIFNSFLIIYFTFAQIRQC